jgi:hypothetical protein
MMLLLLWHGAGSMACIYADGRVQNGLWKVEGWMPMGRLEWPWTTDLNLKLDLAIRCHAFIGVATVLSVRAVSGGWFGLK